MSSEVSPSPTQEQARPRVTPAVRGLVIANVAALFLQATLANYAGTSELFGFSSAQFPARWWQAGTYAFVHSGLWHLAANVYALFLFGPRLENEWGTRRFMWFYALCGLGGVVAAAVFFRGGLLVGSSAGVLGVMAVYA